MILHNTNPFFLPSNNSSLIKRNNNSNLVFKDSTVGFKFNGNVVEEKSIYKIYMSMSSVKDYIHASFEELRLADLEQTKTGKVNKFRIRNTSLKTFDNKKSYNKIFSLGIKGNISLFEKKENKEEKAEGLFSGKSYFDNYVPNSLIFGNNKNSLFDNINKISLFGNNNESGLFNKNNNNEKNTNFLNNKNKDSIVINNKSEPLFQTNLNRESLFNKNKKETKNNQNMINQKIKKCKHEKKYIAYCLENSVNDEGGLICYDCLYKYHYEHISKCIPLKNDFDYYKNYYKQIINRNKIYLKNKFNEIISELEKYENEEIENISKLFENINLKFSLPIEISFLERFEMAVNKKVKSVLDKELNSNNIFKFNYLNLFQNDLKDLEFCENNPNSNETIVINSSVNFNLFGIGIPKISAEKQKLVEVEIYNGIFYQEKVNKFENYNNMTVCIFERPLIIENNIDYSIKIKGIKDLDYINKKEELYNNKSKIKIRSNNSETALSCLIIE